jgi:transcriptional regulator with XRE-family HTH domain
MTRDALELIDADICRGIGVKPNRWSQYVTGTRRITIEVADKLCDRYNVTLDWIYRGDPSALPLALSKRMDTTQAA